MRTITCLMKLPENVSGVRHFQTLDLEDWPNGGYEISSDGRLSFVSPFAWGDELPAASRCGPVAFTGILRFFTSPPEEEHKFVVELKNGQVVSGPSVDED